MKSICTTLLCSATLAGTILLSGCRSSWNTTGETFVGDTTIPHKPATLKSAPIRGSAADQAKPSAAEKPGTAKATKGKAASS